MTLASSLLDIIYPPLCCSCGVKLSNHNRFFLCRDCAGEIKYIRKPVCPACGFPADGFECENCVRADYSFNTARASCVYGGVAAEAVKLFKYGKNLWLSKTLERLFREGLREFPEISSPDVIVPVPLSRVKEKERGFNQSEILSHAAGRMLNVRVSIKNLVRVKHSVPQTELSGSLRRENVRGIFAVKNKGEFEGGEVLLIDDVFTTGSTVNECSRELLRAGARRVNVFTLAKKL